MNERAPSVSHRPAAPPHRHRGTAEGAFSALTARDLSPPARLLYRSAFARMAGAA